LPTLAPFNDRFAREVQIALECNGSEEAAPNLATEGFHADTERLRGSDPMRVGRSAGRIFAQMQ
jgi:hypothetical protein